MVVYPNHPNACSQIDLEEVIRSARPRLVGYARTSTDDQLLDLQIDALNAAGVVEIHTDQESGARKDRPGLARLLADLRRGDTLVVWKLDRLGRSTSHLLAILEDLRDRGIAFRSLTEGIDTGTAVGRMVFTILAAVSEMERENARERIRAGMSAARQRQKSIGRKPALTPAQIEHAAKLRAEGHSLRAIADLLGGHGREKRDGKGRTRLSPSTVQAALRAFGASI